MPKRTNIQKPTIDTIRKFLKDYGSDGWSILTPEGLVKTYGFPAAWLKPLTYEHQSGPGKYQIYDNKTGQPVKSCPGVHSLTVLSRLASQVGAVAPEYFGRGSQARAYTRAILDEIGEQ